MTITYERRPRPASPGSTPWCDLPADHDFAEDNVDGVRMHSVTLAIWENGARRVCVEIEASAETADGVETGGDDLTAAQARSLAAFLPVALNAAADRIEALGT